MAKRIAKDKIFNTDESLGKHEIIEDFLPPPEISHHTKINIISEKLEELFIKLSEEDMQALEKIAQVQGVAPHILAKSILHSFIKDNGSSV